MTVSTASRVAGPYVGNDFNKSFAFSFKVFSVSDVNVITTDAAGKESSLVSGVSVTLNKDQNINPGGKVTLSTALPRGVLLSITSNIDYYQPVDINNQGGFYPEVINNALDRCVVQIQQLKSVTDRSIRFPYTDEIDSYSGLLPVSSVRSGTLLAFNEDGEPIAGPSLVSFLPVSESIDSINTCAENIEDISVCAGVADDIVITARNVALVEDVAEIYQFLEDTMVIPPSSAIDGSIVVFDGTTGRRVRDGNMLVGGEITTPTLDVGAVSTKNVLQLDPFEEANLEYYDRESNTGTPRVISQYPIGQCYFGLPTQDSTWFEHVPFEKADGNQAVRIVPLGEVMARGFNSPISYPLFEIYESRGRGIQRIRYKGKYPLYTVLTGGMVFLERVSNNERLDNAPRFLGLFCDLDASDSDYNPENVSRKYLGCTLGSGPELNGYINPGNNYLACEVADKGDDDGYPGTTTNLRSGQWVRRTIIVNRDVTFYPKGIYSFRLYNVESGPNSIIMGNGVNALDYTYRFRLESGGFSCLFNMSEFTKNITEAL